MSRKTGKIRQEVDWVMMMDDDDNADSFAVKGTFKTKRIQVTRHNYSCCIIV